MKRIFVALGIGALAIAALGGCSNKGTEWNKDAPISERDDSGASVLNFPDGFSNVATKCDGPNRVYVIFHSSGSYGSISVVPNDPRCATK